MSLLHVRWSLQSWYSSEPAQMLVTTKSVEQLNYGRARTLTLPLLNRVLSGSVRPVRIRNNPCMPCAAMDAELHSLGRNREGTENQVAVAARCRSLNSLQFAR